MLLQNSFFVALSLPMTLSQTFLSSFLRHPYPVSFQPLLLFIIHHLLILLSDPAEGVPAHPETREELLLETGCKPMNQSDLLGAVLSIFDQEKLDDASWLVSVDADGGTEGSLEFDVLSIVPDVVAGSGPSHTP